MLDASDYGGEHALWSIIASKASFDGTSATVQYYRLVG